jgi:predicted ArsR family transcriptional regulator
VDIPTTAPGDVLAQPVRVQLVTILGELLRPATTQELAARVGRHPNTVRLQLERLSEAGLLERRTVAQARGRPRHEWAIAAEARPGGRAPQAHGRLAEWLARALARPPGVAEIEAVGREAGREIAPADARPVGDAMQDALAALGFAPRREQPAPARHRYVLGNCPYRSAVRENQPAICALHRGLTDGLLEGIDPGAGLVDFVPKDPDAAGCVIEVAEETPPTNPSGPLTRASGHRPGGGRDEAPDGVAPLVRWRGRTAAT